MIKYLSIKENEALEEFKQALLEKFGKEILELRLFGSKARGDFRKNRSVDKMSDTDVFIVLKKTSLKKTDLIFGIATDISLKYSVDISIKIFSEKEYKERLNLQVPFFLIVQKEGLSL